MTILSYLVDFFYTRRYEIGVAVSLFFTSLAHAMMRGENEVTMRGLIFALKVVTFVMVILAFFTGQDKAEAQIYIIAGCGDHVLSQNQTIVRIDPVLCGASPYQESEVGWYQIIVHPITLIEPDGRNVHLRIAETAAAEDPEQVNLKNNTWLKIEEGLDYKFLSTFTYQIGYNVSLECIDCGDFEATLRIEILSPVAPNAPTPNPSATATTTHTPDVDKTSTAQAYILATATAIEQAKTATTIAQATVIYAQTATAIAVRATELSIPNLTPTPTQPIPNATPTPTACIFGCGAGPIGDTPTPPFFAGDPLYSSPPTSIPNVSLPGVIIPAPPEVPDINFPNLSLPSTPIPNLRPIQVSIGLSYITPIPLTATNNITTIQFISDTMGVMSGSLMGLYTRTLGYSETINVFLYGTDQLTNTLVYSVPDWYAPPLPREIAQVGWDFELMMTDVRRRYGIIDWVEYSARIVSLPVRFVKGLYLFAQMLGPFGLFVGWLLVMFPIVLTFRFLEWIKNFLIAMFNLVLRLFNTLIQVLLLLRKLIPFL